MRSDTERTYQERILRVLVHIQQNLDETLAVRLAGKRTGDAACVRYSVPPRRIVSRGLAL